MARKKTKIRYKRERVVLSDVLPYEVPATFSNRHFYEFLYKNKISVNNVKDFSGNIVLQNLVNLIFGFQSVGKENFTSIPFTYRITHKDNEFRELNICHPRNQLRLIDFYNKYKDLIIYYCSLSPFSIRKPVRVAKFSYTKDKTHYEALSSDISGLEEFDKEYENLRSYFVYEEYSNVYKFYESYKFHRCEKKYNHLLKLDISKCFDSIYTHSLSWALISKDAVKATKSFKNSDDTFSGQFDKLMQELNYQETNGIIIGPEFSRIFAELILQSVDRSVEKKLREKNKLCHKIDYEVFRYVDDYFVFYNTDEQRQKITETFQIELKHYKLSLNSSKEKKYDKPIITEITIAKQYIAKLLEDKLKFKMEEVLDQNICPDKAKVNGSIYLQSKSLITEFKIIIKESQIEYQDILNYTLALIERFSNKILSDYKNLVKRQEEFYECAKQHSDDQEKIEAEFIKIKVREEDRLFRAIIEIIEFTFFIYSVSPRVNTTIKLSNVLMIFVNFMNRRQTKNKDIKHIAFKAISDNVSLILSKNKHKEYAQVETLYLLLVLNELGRNYRLNLNNLISYLDINLTPTGEFYSNKIFNYFSITVLLIYIKNTSVFAKLKDYLETLILDKFNVRKSSIRKDAELILLLMDSLACPYISRETKTKLLDIYTVDPLIHNKIIDSKNVWFTNWKNFNFSKELVAKRSKEVY